MSDNAGTKPESDNAGIKPELNNNQKQASGDLLLALAEFDASNPYSAEENKEYWRPMLNDPQTKEELYCATLASSGNEGLARVSAMNFGLQGTCGCGSTGQFGSKCRCGKYRTTYV